MTVCSDAGCGVPTPSSSSSITIASCWDDMASACGECKDRPGQVGPTCQAGLEHGRQRAHDGLTTDIILWAR